MTSAHLAIRDPHLYLSTGCLHGDHPYCQNTAGRAGPKQPAECKHCSGPCWCTCHRPASIGPFRLLVTGSRNVDDVALILTVLTNALCVAGRPMLVVHGACPSGADLHADELARWMRGKGVAVDVEAHPAVGHQDFGPWPGAGPRRNQHMVDLGADACAAFIGRCTSPRCRRPGTHPSHGTTGCADLAAAAGIPTLRWYRGVDPPCSAGAELPATPT